MLPRVINFRRGGLKIVERVLSLSIGVVLIFNFFFLMNHGSVPNNLNKNYEKFEQKRKKLTYATRGWERSYYGN